MALRSSSMAASSTMTELAPPPAIPGTLPTAYAELCDSLSVERSWRNVQPVLLATFTSVAQLLAAQAQQIQTLQRELAQLQQAAAKERDATAQQIASALAPLQAQLTGVTSDAHHDQLAARVLAQVQVQFVPNATAAAVADEQRAAVNELRADLTKRLESWQTHVETKWRDAHQHATERHTHAIEALVDEQQRAMERATDALELRVSRQIADAVSTAKRDQVELAALEAKVQTQLRACREELVSFLDAKTSRTDVSALIRHELDALTAWQQRMESTHTTRLDDATRSLQDSVAQAHAATASNVAQLKQNMHELLSVVESLQHEASALQSAMSQKIDVDDAKVLVESRATLAGLEHAMHALTQDVSSRTDVERVAEQVQWLAQQLRSELYHARYVWKEGRPSAQQQTIAWTAQVVNSHTDVFVWQTGSDKVLLKIPGLYHLQAAFFTDFSPTICVLVNGEPALVVTGSDGGRENSDDNNQVAGQTYRRIYHSAGNIVGRSLDAFLALPARAVVQISYDIQERAQGFLNLRKL